MGAIPQRARLYQAVGEQWEEPVIADDFDSYHRIADAIRTPVVGGENHFTHHDLKPFFASGKIPILQPGILRGGYAELRIITDHVHRAGLCRQTNPLSRDPVLRARFPFDDIDAARQKDHRAEQRPTIRKLSPDKKTK